ncbi:MAG: diguanylate cyclase [Ralstonia sp.]|uniref:diguanylate cyclase n=1 Tax=Ralstonia TaxID=48736 RepID=UPI0028730213|nr:diguanylate cyclase [Ralstonia pickettii]
MPCPARTTPNSNYRLPRRSCEEFAIVMVDADKAAAAAVMDELRLAVEHSPREGVRGTFSAGVECVMPGDTLAATLARADAALYLAKEKGRNRVIIASKAHEGDVETHGVTATSKLAC